MTSRPYVETDFHVGRLRHNGEYAIFEGRTLVMHSWKTEKGAYKRLVRHVQTMNANGHRKYDDKANG